MGWTSFHISKTDKTVDVIKRELTGTNSDGTSWTVADCTMRGAVFYGVMCREQLDPAKRAAGTPEKMFYGMVVLTERRTVDGETEIFYKDMGEDVGPCYYDMPARMLNFLDQHSQPQGFAKDWRMKCRAKLELKRLLSAAKRENKRQAQLNKLAGWSTV